MVSVPTSSKSRSEDEEEEDDDDEGEDGEDDDDEIDDETEAELRALAELRRPTAAPVMNPVRDHDERSLCAIMGALGG